MHPTVFVPLLLASAVVASAPLAPPASGAAQKEAPKREKALESKDDGKFFGEAAWKRVAPAAEKLLKEKGLDFVVETVEAPKGDADKLAALKPAEREKFFKGLADERVKELKLKGVYVFVSKKPATLYVEVPEAAGLPKDFGPKLKGALIASFKDAKYDEGLNKALDMTLDAKGLGEKK